MRPALEALASQQKQLEKLAAQNQQLRQAALTHQAAISQLSRGLEAVARLTNTDRQVRTAIFTRTADEQNPAQPIPDPAGEPSPTGGTVQAETPEAKADVRAPGLVPGTNQDVAADAVTTAYTPGQDIPDTALGQLDDVTRPIDGTQGPRPLSETKTLTDVRVGDPMKAQVAFPVNGPFANAQRTSSVNEENEGERAFASMRLARLRITAGMSESGDDMIESTEINKSAVSLSQINDEIATLDRVSKAAGRRTEVDAPRNLVPQRSSVRTTPRISDAARTASLNEDDADVLFLGDI